jgi:hypothetical protein
LAKNLEKEAAAQTHEIKELGENSKVSSSTSHEVGTLNPNRRPHYF